MEVSKSVLAQHERLVILAEECAEVQQVICKALRHGIDSDNNGKNPETNRQMIERELGDLLHSAQRCFDRGDLSESVVEERRRLPEIKAAYLHYQQPPCPNCNGTRLVTWRHDDGDELTSRCPECSEGK